MSAARCSNRTTSHAWALPLMKSARAAILTISSLTSSIATSTTRTSATWSAPSVRSIAGPAIERTEGADHVADVRVVDVAIDDVSDDIVRMAARADFISGNAHACDVVRFEQRAALIGRHPLAVEHAIKYQLNSVRGHV